MIKKRDKLVDEFVSDYGEFTHNMVIKSKEEEEMNKHYEFERH